MISMLDETVVGYRLSPQQKRLWTLQQESPVYNSQIRIGMQGPLDVPRLKTVLQTLIRQNEILRTAFHFIPGVSLPVQIIKENPSFTLPETDLTGMLPGRQLLEINRIWEEELSRDVTDNLEIKLRNHLYRLAPDNHVLCLSLPSLCVDFVSLRLLFISLCDAYANDLKQWEGREYIQFADVAEWQNEIRVSPNAVDGELYWRRMDYFRFRQERFFDEAQVKSEGRFQPKVVSASVPAIVHQKLAQLAEKQGVSAGIIYLSLWLIWLYRTQGSENTITGYAFDRRKYAELENALGPLTVYLPMQLSLTANSSLSDVIETVTRQVEEGLQWEDYFDWKAGDRAETGLDEQDYFSYGFDYRQQPDIRRELGVQFSIERWEVCSERFKLRLSCCAANGVVTLNYYFDSDLISEEKVHRVSRQFQTLLESAQLDWAGSIEEISLLDPDESRQILIEFNRSEATYDHRQCLHKLIESQVEKSPRDIAVISDEGALSYQELNERANQLARYLRRHGIGAGEKVGVCLDRSLELPVCLLAVLKSGACYIPLDPSLPTSRLSYMLNDAQVSFVLTRGAMKNRVLDTNVSIIDLEAESRAIDEISGQNLDVNTLPTEPAYILYTSGSTGNPKGVVLPHLAVANRILWGQTVYPLSSKDRVLQSAAVGFDFSVWEIFAPLMAGAAVVLPRPGGHQDLAHLISLIERSGVTVAHFVPSLFQLFLEEPDLDRCQSLKTVFCGGEELPPALKERFYACFDADLYNQYGPTEAAIDVSYHLCSREFRPLGREKGKIPIGRPITNIQLYILDRKLQPVPLGVAGQLHIAGEGLADGYWARPALTAEKFIPNPFATKPGGRLYRTGDLARFRSDGSIEFLGRLDHQVKLRGLRIELGEIESLLRTRSEIADAVVVLREDHPGDKQLVAYIVLKMELNTGANISAEELSAWLGERVPGFMIPAKMVFLSSFPLTPNGKLDRTALPAPEKETGQPSAGYLAPRTPVEEALIDIYSAVLKCEKISVLDNFFKLGGHSLMAMQLISRIRKAFQIDLPLRALFAAPVVESLAEQIEIALIEKLDALTEEEAEGLLPDIAT